MSNDDFFERQKENSKVKTEIVCKYFDAFSTVFKNKKKDIAYIDLCCGPGYYENREKSTPIILIENILEDKTKSDKIRIYFNDKDHKAILNLKKEIERIHGIENLKYSPEFSNYDIDKDVDKLLQNIPTIPSFIFIDTFGYKGIRKSLIKKVAFRSNCDCVVFFNYKRFNAAVNNDRLEEPINEILSEPMKQELLKKIATCTPRQREFEILEAIFKELQALSFCSRIQLFVLPFCFKEQHNTRTSHYLFFITKSFLGYDIMKDVMAKCSTRKDEGVPSFSYCSADKNQPLLFSFTQPLESLKESLLAEFKGREISFKDLYEKHSVGKPFVKRNYKDILIELKNNGIITTDREPKKGTFPDNLMITFR